MIFLFLVLDILTDCCFIVTIGGLFLPVKRYYDKSSHLVVDLPATKAILNGIQADLSCTPHFTMRYAWMYWSQEYWGSKV